MERSVCVSLSLPLLHNFHVIYTVFNSVMQQFNTGGKNWCQCVIQAMFVLENMDYKNRCNHFCNHVWSLAIKWGKCPPRVLVRWLLPYRYLRGKVGNLWVHRPSDYVVRALLPWSAQIQVGIQGSLDALSSTCGHIMRLNMHVYGILHTWRIVLQASPPVFFFSFL